MATATYKYDIHVHTSETSCCGEISAADTVALYRAAGYSGICITDHYSHSCFDWEDGTWREKADRFLKGYRAARDAAGGELDIILGAEVHFGAPGNHTYKSNDYLVYGLTEELIYAYPEMHHLTLPEFSRIAKKHDLLVIQAHPMRDNMELVHLDLLDGIEVYNAHPNHNSRNDEVAKFAKSCGHDFILTSGSDCHDTHHAARGGIITHRRIPDAAALRDIIKSRSFELIYAE